MTRSMEERGKEWSAFERVQQWRIREHRAKVEQFIEELKSIDDAQLMLLYDEQFRGYQNEVERVKSHGQGQGGDVGCPSRRSSSCRHQAWADAAATRGARVLRVDGPRVHAYRWAALMSAVLESLPVSPVEQARAALESAQVESRSTDARIRECERNSNLRRASPAAGIRWRTGCNPEFPGLLIRGLFFGLGRLLLLLLFRVLLLLLFLPEQGLPSTSVRVHLDPFQFCRGLGKVSVFLFGTQILEFANGQKPKGRGHAFMMPPVASMLCPLHAYLMSQAHLRQRGWAAGAV